MSDSPETPEKPSMSKVTSILSIVARVMNLLAVTIIAVVAFGTAYIVFAPDEFPKPFHLQYVYPTAVPIESENGITPEITEEPTPTPHVYKPGDGVMVNMATKIINLSDPTGRKYIRVTMVLEFVPPEPTKEGESETSGGHGGSAEAATTHASDFETQIQARMPILDDVVITLLSTKTFDDLYTADGKENLRQELMTTISKRMPEYQILSVYFTEFVVQ